MNCTLALLHIITHSGKISKEQILGMSYLTVSVARSAGTLAQIMEKTPRCGRGIVLVPLARTVTLVAPTLRS
jgi:hypothetical protein